jgi:hypothetical protein
VVRYVVPVSQRLDALTDGEKFRLAVAATAGAEASDPRHLGHDSCTNAAFSIDGEDHFECTLAATPANVTALEATGFRWSPAACGLAGRVGASGQPVEEARAAVAEAERDWAARVAASSERTPDAGQTVPPPTPSPPPASGSWLARQLRRLIRRRGESGGGAVQRP